MAYYLGDRIMCRLISCDTVLPEWDLYGAITNSWWTRIPSPLQPIPPVFVLAS